MSLLLNAGGLIPSIAEAIPLLLDYYIEEAAGEFGKPKPSYPPRLPQLLATHHFTGNLRELSAMVYDAVGKHSSGAISMEAFQSRIYENDASALDCPGAQKALFRQFGKLRLCGKRGKPWQRRLGLRDTG